MELVETALLSMMFLLLLAMVIKLKKNQFEQAAVIESLQGSLNAVCSGAVGIGEHLSILEDRSRLMMERQEKFELHGGSSTNYKFAMKMAKGGAKIEDVIEDCDMPMGEAELVLLANKLSDK